MKFTHVKFSEEKNLRGNDVKPGKVYEYPLTQAQKFEAGEPAYQDHAGEYDVDDSDVADKVGNELDDSKYFQEKEDKEELTEEEKFLEERTVSEVEESVKEISDVARLKGIYKVAERKGAKKAIKERLGQLKESEEDSEDEEEEGEE